MTSTVDESESDDNSADQTFENNGCASLTKPMGHTGNAKLVSPGTYWLTSRNNCCRDSGTFHSETIEVALQSETLRRNDAGASSQGIYLAVGLATRGRRQDHRHRRGHQCQAGQASPVARAQERPCPTETAVRPPPLVPFFPIGPFNPDSRCGHNRPIQAGSVLCCMVCHCSGMDDHPALKRNPLTDPAPEPKPPPARKAAARETRKQRRQKIYGIHP